MKHVSVGILGFGTVGAGVADCLLKNRGLIRERTGVDVELTGIGDLDTTTRRVHCDNKWFKTIPESWTVFRIKNVCDIVRGGQREILTRFLSKPLQTGLLVIVNHQMNLDMMETITSIFHTILYILKIMECGVLRLILPQTHKNIMLLLI